MAFKPAIQIPEMTPARLKSQNRIMDSEAVRVLRREGGGVGPTRRVVSVFRGGKQEMYKQMVLRCKNVAYWTIAKHNFDELSM